MTKDREREEVWAEGAGGEEVGGLDNIHTRPTSPHLCRGPRKISLRRKITIQVGDQAVLSTGSDASAAFSGEFPSDLWVLHTAEWEERSL